MKTLDELVQWLSEIRVPLLSREDCWRYYQIFRPSTRFIKTLNLNSHVLDFGAGTGGAVGLKTWPEPAREDLKFFAYSLKYAKNFENYDGYEIGNFEVRTPEFTNIEFSAVFASHVIEHLNDPDRFFAWAVQRTAQVARFYLEWPSADSMTLPRKNEFMQKGFDIMITNFFDDGSHVAIPSRESIVTNLTRLGLTIEEQGVIRAPFLEGELLASAESWPTEFEKEIVRRNAFWSYTSWAQYVIASKNEKA
jgi:hypothetical protein